jgi:hypothetical protein
MWASAARLLTFSLTIRALTTTRRILPAGLRSPAARLSRSAAAWPRPIRRHLPEPPRRRPPRICESVTGPPLALAPARNAWVTNGWNRGLAGFPRPCHAGDAVRRRKG